MDEDISLKDPGEISVVQTQDACMNDVAVRYSYRCGASPSLNLYIKSLGSLDEFFMSSVLILLPNDNSSFTVATLSKNLEEEMLSTT